MKNARLLAALVALSSLSAAAALPRPSGVAFDKGAPFAVNGYAGSTPLSGFPVLVRIAANSPVGFYYTDLHSQSDGADIAFVDRDGNGLPFEIDTWNPSGTSLIWVKLPTMTNGTQFVMCWGSAASGKTVCADSPFAGYVGVWHMSEASGTVADSSGNGFAATPSGVAATNVSVAVAGVVGNGRQCSTDLGASNLSYLSVPSYDSKSVGDTFAVSGWVSIGSGQAGNDNDARLFSRKENYQNAHGWEILWKTGKEIRVRGAASGDNIKVTNLDYAGKGWKHIFVVYDNKNAVFYENGVSKKSTTNGTAASDNDKPLAIGGYANDNGSQLVGSVDECRLLDAVPAADWAKAEYDSMTDASFLTAGEAELYGESSAPVAGILVSSVGYTNATVVVALSDFGTGAASADGALEVAATADFAAPLLTETYSAANTGPRSFDVPGLSTNTTYFVRVFLTNDLQAATAVAPVSFTTLAPGAPAGAVSLFGRDASSISATATVSSSGTAAGSASVRLEVSTDGFATTVSSAWEDVSANASRVLTVSGLAALTVYDVRLRIRNEWGIETVSDLGRIATLPSSGVEELYVDSLGHGNGTSPESALPTIREALDIAGPGFTIWVHGGPDRSYDVTNAADALSIPASMEHLAIRSFGGEGPAKMAVAAEYTRDWRNAGNSGNVNVISNAAEHVTIEGFRFEWGQYSLGRDKNGGSSLVWTDAPFLTLSGCEFVQTAGSSYASSGTTPVIWCYQANATNLLVEGCRFFNCRMSDGNLGRDYYLITPRGQGSVVGCLFTNCAAVVDVPNAWNNPIYGCSKLTFVSNTVFAARTAAASGILRASYTGPDTGEIAYNRFVNVAGSPPGAVLEKSREGWNGAGGVSIHHNTVVGYRTLICANALTYNASLITASVFDNILLLSPESTNIVENADGRINGNDKHPTMFRTGSFYRNNALRAGAFNGGTAAALQIEGWTYDITAGLAVSNVLALDAATAQSVTNVFASAGKPVPEDAAFAMNPPEFVNLSDPFDPNFARARASRGPDDIGVVGWRGENGEYPLYVGALPPLYPGATMLILR